MNVVNAYLTLWAHWINKVSEIYVFYFMYMHANYVIMLWKTNYVVIDDNDIMFEPIMNFSL